MPDSDQFTELMNTTMGVNALPESVSKEDIVWQNDKVVIVKPTTVEASQEYGRGAHWSTAAMGADNRFEEWRKRFHANLYYLLPQIDMEEKYTKIGVASYPTGKTEYYDYHDNPMSTEEFNEIKQRLDIP